MSFYPVWVDRPYPYWPLGVSVEVKSDPEAVLRCLWVKIIYMCTYTHTHPHKRMRTHTHQFNYSCSPHPRSQRICPLLLSQGHTALLPLCQSQGEKNLINLTVPHCCQFEPHGNHGDRNGSCGQAEVYCIISAASWYFSDGSLTHKQTAFCTDWDLIKTKNKTWQFHHSMSSMTGLYLHSAWYNTMLSHIGSSLTCFKSYFPVFAVEIWIDEVPEDVCPMRQGEGVEKLRHSQGGQLTKLWL